VSRLAHLFCFIKVFKVYVLHSDRLNKYYIGHTSDIESRLLFHNDLVRNKIWTKRGIPWTLIIQFTVKDKSTAIQVEKFIKSQKSKTWLERIIAERKFILDGNVIASDPD
jgi:putative endonuclease